MEPNIEKSDAEYAERDVVQIESAENGGNTKLDKHGLPLVPQPTDHADDPLVIQLLLATYAETLF